MAVASRDRGLFITAVVAVIVGVVFVGVMALAGNDPEAVLTKSGFTKTANDYDIVNVQEDLSYHPFLP